MLDDQFAHLVNDTARSSWKRVRQQPSGKLFSSHMHLLLAEYFTVTEAGMGVYRSTVWHQLTCSSAVFAWSWPLSALYFSPGVVFMLRNWGQRSVPAYLAVMLWSVCRGLKNEMKLEMECKNFLLESGCLLFLSSLLLDVISIALTYLIGSLKWETKKAYVK